MTKNLFKILCLTFLLFACGKEEEKKPEPEIKPQAISQLKLVPATFLELANWAQDDTNDILKAFQASCGKIKFIKKEFISHSEIKIPTAAYQEICKKLNNVTPDTFKSFIETNFNPYLVTFNGKSEGKFTSYYESALKASYHQSDKYKFPIYGKPKDLVEFNPQDFDATLPSKRLLGRVQNQKLIPYYTRAEINTKNFEAPVILWTDSYIDLYIMQIQGSAVADLEDGSKVRISYADNNGLPFKGIGSILLEKKQLNPGQASMMKIKDWLHANPQKAQAFMDENQRYIFHRLIESDGPIGAQGLPLTAGRSLAVDKSYIPLGSLLWLDTTLPKHGKTSKLMIAQDVGGAIKGAIRGDYFWGSGGDDILHLAGQMNAAGKYYILLPKTMEITND